MRVLCWLGTRMLKDFILKLDMRVQASPVQPTLGWVGAARFVTFLLNFGPVSWSTVNVDRQSDSVRKLLLLYLRSCTGERLVSSMCLRIVVRAQGSQPHRVYRCLSS